MKPPKSYYSHQSNTSEWLKMSQETYSILAVEFAVSPFLKATWRKSQSELSQISSIVVSYTLWSVTQISIVLPRVGGLLWQHDTNPSHLSKDTSPSHSFWYASKLSCIGPDFTFISWSQQSMCNRLYKSCSTIGKNFIYNALQHCHHLVNRPIISNIAHCIIKESFSIESFLQITCFSANSFKSLLSAVLIWKMFILARSQSLQLM